MNTLNFLERMIGIILLPVIDGNLRKFKIDLDYPHGYENNWELLDL